MRITFNALDKNSSASHSRTVSASSKEELEKAWKEFEVEVDAIFFKWYYDNEVDEEESSGEEIEWAKELDLLD